MIRGPLAGRGILGYGIASASYSLGDTAWTPSELTGLGLWYDCSLIGGSDGDGVTTLTDSSGNGDNATGPGGTQVTLQTVELDGKNVIRFGGAAGFSVSGAVGLTNNVAGIGAIAVIKPQGLTENYVYFSTPTAGTSRFLLSRTGGSARQGGRRLDADSFAATSTVSVTTGAWILLGGIQDYTNTDAHLRIDGNASASNTSFQTAGSASATNSSVVNIGSQNGGGIFTGDLAELVVWIGTMSSSDWEKVEGYLAHKWGLEANLPVSHPYKSAPP